MAMPFATLSTFRNYQGKTELANAFSGYKLQLDNRTSSSNKIAILEKLREVYPDHTVACVNAGEVDFRGYCAAHSPHCVLIPVLNRVDAGQFDMYDAACRYEAPARRLDQSPGDIRDMFNFVQYDLEWHGQEMTVFFASWTPIGMGCVSYWFILSSREAGIAQTPSVNPPYTCPAGTADILLQVGKWTSELHEEIYVFDDFRWKKSKSLWKSIQGSSWDDVIMDPATKRGLIEDVQGFFKKETQQLYEQYGVSWKRGIILHGSPGNGKTISIKALVNALAEIAVPAMYVRTFANQRGMPQLSVAQIFEKARGMAPCLLIFEDLDSLLDEKVRAYFLNEVDGLESNEGLLMIGSTNHLDKLDPAVAKRPSRFDRKYHFAIPDRTQRIAYAEFWRAKFLNKNDEKEFPLDACAIVADISHGFSFAYMKELFVSTMISLAQVRGPNGDQALASLASSADQITVVEPEAVPAAESDPRKATEQSTFVNVEATPVSASCLKKAGPNAMPSVRAIPMGMVKLRNEAAVKNSVPANSLSKEDRLRIQAHLSEGLPDAMKECVLMQVLLHHVKILIREMDNTTE